MADKMTLVRAVSSCVLAGSLGLGGLCFASTAARTPVEVELPRAVPGAKLIQEVGLTEIAVEYDRPSVAGRKIWGELVPFERPWVIAGNPGAKIKFSRDVTIADKVVPAGTYWLLAIPSKGVWTLIINKSPDPVASANDYKPSLDVARVKVAVKSAPTRERLTFLFSDLTDDRAALDLEWAGVRVSLPIQLNTTRHIEAEISGLDDAWRAYANAARYMLETKKDYDGGLKYIDRSLALQASERSPDWYCLWIKGALLAAKGQYGQARELAQNAYDLAKGSGKPFPLEPDLSRAIAAWQKKAGPFEKKATASSPIKNEPAPAGPGAGPRVVQPATEAGSDPRAETPIEAPAPASAAAPEAPSVKAGPMLKDPPVLRRARLRHR